MDSTQYFPSFAANVISYTLPPSEPSSYKEAIKYLEWQQAISGEFAALEANKTWLLVKLFAGKKPISCKWIFKMKQNSDETIDRYKVRLVVCGYTHIEGVVSQKPFHQSSK